MRKRMMPLLLMAVISVGSAAGIPVQGQETPAGGQSKPVSGSDLNFEVQQEKEENDQNEAAEEMTEESEKTETEENSEGEPEDVTEDDAADGTDISVKEKRGTVSDTKAAEMTDDAGDQSKEELPADHGEDTRADTIEDIKEGTIEDIKTDTIEDIKAGAGEDIKEGSAENNQEDNRIEGQDAVLSQTADAAADEEDSGADSGHILQTEDISEDTGSELPEAVDLDAISGYLPEDLTENDFSEPSTVKKEEKEGYNQAVYPENQTAPEEKLLVKDQADGGLDSDLTEIPDHTDVDSRNGEEALQGQPEPDQKETQLVSDTDSEDEETEENSESLNQSGTDAGTGQSDAAEREPATEAGRAFAEPDAETKTEPDASPAVTSDGNGNESSEMDENRSDPGSEENTGTENREENPETLRGETAAGADPDGSITGEDTEREAASESENERITEETEIITEDGTLPGKTSEKETESEHTDDGDAFGRKDTDDGDASGRKDTDDGDASGRKDTDDADASGRKDTDDADASGWEETQGTETSDETVSYIYAAELIGNMNDAGLCEMEFADSGFTVSGLSRNEQTVYQFLRDELGLNKAAASGIMANIYCESGFSTVAIGNNSTSIGLCQWQDARCRQLTSWCFENGYDYRSLEGQLEYLRQEFENGYSGVYQYVMNVEDTPEGAYRAGYYFCMYYENPTSVSTRSDARGLLAKNSYYSADLDACISR